MSIPTRTSRAVPHLRSPKAEALELIADILLQNAGRDEQYPAYSEDQLARKTTRSNRRQWQGCRPDMYVDLLLASELDDLVLAAGLAAEEECAWRMHMEGALPEEVADMLGTTRPRAVRLIHSARNRVAACGSRSRGLYSSYLSLLHRCIYHRSV